MPGGSARRPIFRICWRLWGKGDPFSLRRCHGPAGGGRRGVGEAANPPRVLLDMAVWCGVDVPVQVITVGARTTSPVVVYARDRADLVRQLRDHGVLVDAGDRVLDLRQMLDLDGGDLEGGQGWVWPPRLTRTHRSHPGQPPHRHPRT